MDPSKPIESLYDPYIHSGRTNFVYGQPFSYFSEPVRMSSPRTPPGFENTDLNRNAREFSPRECSPREFSPRERSPMSPLPQNYVVRYRPVPIMYGPHGPVVHGPHGLIPVNLNVPMPLVKPRYIHIPEYNNENN